MVTTRAKADLRLQVGSVDLRLVVATNRNGEKLFTRRPSAPRKPRPLPDLAIPHFGSGCGAFYFQPGTYAICLNGDCRYGWLMPGPREEADLTGIAAGYRVKKIIKHGDVNFALTYNGTNTRIYRVESGAWAQKLEVTSNEGFDIVSFKDVVAVGFNTSTGYRFSSDDGGTWSTSTKTSGNASKAKYFVVQTTGLTTPRVAYAVDPNELYFTEDLTNGDPSGSTDTKVGDNASDQQKITSLTEDVDGRILAGTRHVLYRLDPDENGLLSLVTAVSRWYPDPPADAGGQGDRDNFEQYAKIDDRIWYNVAGYELVEYHNGRIRNENLAPWRTSERAIPRMQLPINAVTQAHGWVLVAVGSKNTSTLKAVTHAPAGGQLTQNTFGTTSDIYAGRYQEDPPGSGQIRFVWHGILLVTTDPLRFMWLDEDDSYLYLASGDSESVNAQMLRCRFPADNPLYRLYSSAIVLNTGTVTLELGRIDFDDPDMVKILRSFRAHTLGLASTTPSLHIEYRPEAAYDTSTAYTDLGTDPTYVTNASAETGTSFPASKTFRTMWMRFEMKGNSGSNLYGVLIDAELTAEAFTEHFDVLEFTANVDSGSLDGSGVYSLMSARQVSDAISTWRDGTTLATLTDIETQESWTVQLEGYSISGLGQDMTLSVVCREAVT